MGVGWGVGCVCGVKGCVGVWGGGCGGVGWEKGGVGCVEWAVQRCCGASGGVVEVVEETHVIPIRYQNTGVWHKRTQ